ncbi:MAG: hypothetical protein EA398_10755 [Deltaproteobacteria bacterium]|nr:MAG: hypothetical protein EA398_10755 [Deltaproteobacteria bacterium]
MPPFARRHRLLLLLSTLALVLAAACGSTDGTGADPSEHGPSEPGPDPSGTETPDPVPGQDSFVSADAQEGQSADPGGTDLAEEDAASGPPGADGGRTVEEGDIYRVLAGDRILNLNAYRGLQVIDFADVTDPQIIGRYSITGTPVELYAYEDRAIVLMNNWRGYYGSRFSTVLDEVHGGVVAIIDISRPEKPVLLSQSHIPGHIQRSRLVRGGGQAALYVAAGEYGQFEDPETGDMEWGTRTFVKSFDVSGPVIEDRTELELGGYVTDIQATPEVLMVARGTHRWWSRGDGSTVTLVDISAPDGTMTRGDEVRVRGRVQSQFNMDLYNGVLRVVSGNRWGSGQGNWVQTFDASDLSSLTLIDEETFGDPSEDLYATIFLGNKAFFVTYFQVDPFHAFEITDEGIATERNEFIVSGWNDFFRPVAGETRLIGIGMNDEGGAPRAAVSLYDITDLYNTEPLMARAEVSTSRWTWSEANWDHRAFSVLENAVSVTGEDGVEETGLVLLPFSGWDGNHYRSAVQIFSFSADSLTLRGTMEHPDPVRRTFLPKDETATNFSETEMRFHDVADPDAPAQLGAVELAPNYEDVWVFGDHAVRHRSPNRYWWTDRSGDDPDGALEVFRTHEDPDIAEPVGAVAIPGNATVTRTGDTLTVLSLVGHTSGDNHPRFEIRTVNLDDPRRPALRDAITVTLPGWYNRGWYGGPWHDDGFRGMVWDGGYGHGGGQLAFADGVLVHRETRHHSEALGEAERCWWNLRDHREHQNCWSSGPSPGEGRDGEDPHGTDADPETWECTRHQGYRNCNTDHLGRTTCSGELTRCTIEMPHGNVIACEPLTDEEIDRLFRRTCDTYTEYRRWQTAVLHRVDLSSPASPRALPPLETDAQQEIRGGATLDGRYHLMWAEPVRVDDDPRRYVRWFFREVDLRADSIDEAFGPAVNVPGMLVQREGDALLTRDNLYGTRVIETAIHRLDLVDDTRAVLRGTARFRDAWVRDIALDGDGLALVNHQPWWSRHGGWGDVVVSDGDGREEPDTSSRLSIYRIADDGFAPLADVPVDDWAHLRTATPGRAVFSAGQGVLILNLDDPAAPFPQTYAGLRGWWPSSFVPVGDRLWIPSGRFGIQEIDANDWNLLER